MPVSGGMSVPSLFCIENETEFSLVSPHKCKTTTFDLLTVWFPITVLFRKCNIFKLFWCWKLMGLKMLHFLQVFGIVLMVLGVLLFIAPILLEKMPSLESIPWIILYVYRRDGFVFVTSPLLIIISIASLLWWILTRSGTP